MTCPRCRRESPASARFCMHCGSTLAPGCRRCALAVPAGARFCIHCGAPVEAPGELRPYTPPHLAERILAGRTALEGERKQVTVLFADVEGSVELSRELGAEAWHMLLDRFFEILTRAVHRYDGTVNQYTGDGIMALFGAPFAHEDHAQRACFAALGGRAELAALDAELRSRQGAGLPVRMGLNSGEVVVGTIGDRLRQDYTAQGAVVGLAARMQQLAPAGRAYLTGETARLVADFFELRAIGEARVRGADAPLAVFELLGEGRLQTRFELSRSRGLSPFVGREGELAALEVALEHALAGRGAVVGVVAAPGLGKSRLCYEFAERCRTRGFSVHAAHCLSHARMLSFHPVRELLRSFFGVDEHDEEAAARSKVAGELVLLDPDLAEYVPLVLDFLRLGDPQQPVPALDPGQRQARLFDAFGRLLQATSRARPAVFLLEDLHWADESSDALVGAMVDQAATHRSLLLLNFRPEYRAEWMSRPIYQQLALRPLDDRASEGLLADLLGRDPSVVELAALIRERAGGNPFFIEEIVRSLVEAGDLAGGRGRHRLRRGLASLRIPASVQALVASRIDRLSEDAKVALQSAAVLGKRFSAPVLREVSQLPLRELAGALEKLCEAEFLHPETFYPTAEYVFAHPLLQEVAYRSSLSEVRARRHRVAAEVLSARPAPAAAEWAALLAHHWEEAGERLEAADCHREAGEHLLVRHDGAAFRHFERALELSCGVPGSSRAREIGLLACARLLDWGGRLRMGQAEADRLFALGSGLAEASGDAGAAARIAASHSVFSVWQGAIPDALGPLERAVALGEGLGSWEEVANARLSLALARYFSGRIRLAAAELEALVGEALGRGEAAASGRASLALVAAPALTLLAQARIDLGELGEARRVLRRTAALADREGAPGAIAHVRAAEALLWVAFGDAERALDAAARAAELATGSSLRTAPVESFRALAAAHLLAGRLEASRDAAESALEIANQTDPGLVTGIACRIALSQVRAVQGEAASAAADAERAIADCRSRGYRVQLPEALLARARAGLASGEPRAALAAEAEVAAAREHAGAMARRILAPQIELLGAEIARRRGDEEAARSRALAAARAWRSVGSPARAAEVERHWGLAAC